MVCISTGLLGRIPSGKEVFRGVGRLLGIIKGRDGAISTLEDEVSDLKGDLEHSHLTDYATKRALDHYMERCGRVFVEKESFMLSGIKKGKKIK